MPLQSFSKTYEEGLFSYKIYIGYDIGDSFFDNKHHLEQIYSWSSKHIPSVDIKTVSFVNVYGKPGPIMNFLSKRAYIDGCEFMYRINDDTEFLTIWTTPFVEALKAFHPSLVGVVGPTCREGNTKILTHDFVSKKHYEIFSFHYPPELKDWWLDDWISFVYGNKNTRKLSTVKIKHHIKVRRYLISWKSKEKLKPLLEEGRNTIRMKVPQF
jgi:hypothetical protein